jgi:Ni/Fe-hydrogenase subunit HybB-like protein
MSHSGTLLSAILHIMHADWRKPIYRFAEAMTTFSLMTAGLFVLVHLGRVWQFYYVVAYPNERWAWPNFSSPLVWDATAIGSYLTTSVIFLYFGMIPDLAICRDKATGIRRLFYRAMSVGWMGTDRQWSNFRITYLTIACLLIPLAVSVHSIVATDFAVSQQPGWHTTSFPPYFVAGALYSGCAAIITLFIILRYTFRFEQYMTIPILEKLCKLTFAISMVWTYLNLIEYAVGLVRHRPFAKQALIYRATGTYAGWWWAMNILGSVVPFALTFKAIAHEYPDDDDRVAAAQSRHVDRALHDRHADLRPRLLSLDLDRRLVAELGAGRHHPRQLRLVHDAVHAVLQDLPVGLDVRGQGNGLPPSSAQEASRGATRSPSAAQPGRAEP